MGLARVMLRPAVIAAVAAAVVVALTVLLSSIASGSGASTPAADRAHPRLGRELPNYRNRYSRTYETDAGTYVTRTYPAPVNYRDADDWKPIDNALVKSSVPGYAFQNKADSYSLLLPDSLDAKPVRFSSGDEWVSFSLRGAGDARAVATAGMVGYRDVLPGVDVDYEAQASRAKEALVLRKPGAARSFSFDVDLSDGLRPRANDDGGIDFVDLDGRAQLVFAPPSMVDAAGATSDAVSMKANASGSAYAVTVAADDDWLDSEAREYPVTVDPTSTNAPVSEDCYLVGGSSANTSFCGSAASWLYAGTDGSGNPRRPYLKYNVSAVPKDAEVVEGQFNFRTLNGSQREIDLHRVLRSSTSARTWNTSDGTNSWPAGGDISSAYDGRNTTMGNGGDAWWNIEARQLVQDWVDGSTTNHGVILKPVGGSGLMQMYASEQSSSSPVLEVEWHARTGVQGRWTFDDQRLSDRAVLKTNVANGNLTLEESDVHIPGTAGHDLDFKRYYNSREGDVGGSNDDIGRYWRMGTGYDVWLKFEGGDSTAAFNGPSGVWAPYDRNDDGSYKTPTGMNADLKKNADTTYTLKYRQSDRKLNFNSTGENLTSDKDRNGNTISFAYNGTGGKLLSIKDTHDQGTANNTLSLSYNGSGWVNTITDRANPQRAWQYGYTGNLLTSYTNPDGKVTSYAYDASERLTDITDPRGNVTHITYDSSKRVTSIRRWTDAAHTTGPLTQYSYTSTPDSDCTTNPTLTDVVGETIETDPNGHTIKFCWDKLQRVKRTIDGRGKKRGKEYTDHSDVTKLTSSLNQALELTFDDNDRFSGTKSQQASGQGNALTTLVGYDSAIHDTADPKFWLQKTSTDTQGNQSSYDYDSEGNLTAVKDPVGSTIAIAPNANGTPDTITDPAGGLTDYGYNGEGDLTTIDRAGTALGTESFTYDPAHPHTTKTHTEGRGKVATYTYDKLGRVAQIAYDDGTWVAYAYDSNGNVVTRIDATGQSTYEYDALNRLTKETFPGGRINTYAYDNVGNLAFFNDAGGTTAYVYGPSNLLDSMLAPGDSGATTFTYTDDDQRKSTNYPNGVVMTATWEDGSAGNSGPGRLKRIKAVKGATTISDFSYGYSAGGLDTGLRRTVTDKTGATASFSYGPVNRLIGASNLDGHNYAYGNDTRGNILYKEKDGVRTSHGYNAANELCWTVTGTQPDYDCTPAPTGATVYSFDAAGNMTSGGTFSATYNAKEQTTAMSGVAGEASIGLSHANTNQFERATAGPKTQVNNGLGVGYDVSGATNTYYRRDDESGLQSMRIGAGTPYYYVFDGLGSVVAVTDSNGAAQNTYKYEPYGAANSVTGSVPNPWQFAAGYHDTTGWYKFGMRYYSGRLGRWSQLDPVEHPTDPRQQNRFGYAGGDPVNTTDQSGKCFYPTLVPTTSLGPFYIPLTCSDSSLAAPSEPALPSSATWCLTSTEPCPSQSPLQEDYAEPRIPLGPILVPEPILE
jgi:RHS repeat-associated protein